jgi:hypothetical protein
MESGAPVVRNETVMSNQSATPPPPKDHFDNCRKISVASHQTYVLDLETSLVHNKHTSYYLKWQSCSELDDLLLIKQVCITFHVK